MKINELLSLAVAANASDLHISTHHAPIIRVDGSLKKLDDLPVLDHDTALGLLQETMTAEHKHVYEKELEIDYAYEIEGLARFRVNAFHHSNGAAGAFRTIPSKTVPLDVIGGTEALLAITNKLHGLVLVTGPTGSGKSTTLAAMIDHINHHNKDHILTIEDPIEFAHKSDKCLINQRELGQSTHSFEAALRSALREDPDVILVGEMRDLETVRLALTAAETGHLVFSTLHTNSAAETIDRIVNIFPTGEQYLIRSMLSVALQGVISQVLLKKIGGGRVVAHEIMMCTPAIRNMIRENKVPQIFSALQTGQNLGMHTMEQYVHELLKQGKIDKATAEPYFRG